MQPACATTPETVAGMGSLTVEAPARLHLGFVDLNGSLGRRFGSLGLGLEGIATQVTVTRAREPRVFGPESERVKRVIQTLWEHVGRVPEAQVQVTRTIPPHVGLGSGTQLALAVGVALNRLLGWGLSVEEIAGITDRGARSGMGVGAFKEGGFFLDGGKGPEGALPPILARIPFPGNWRVLLVLDEQGQGIHGQAEKEAFAGLPPFPEAEAAHLARLVLMRILPALQEQDVIGFGSGLGELQAILGDYFAPAQGGRFTSTKVAEVMDWLQDQGIVGVGQSSWGPTGFAVVGDPGEALRLQHAIGERFSDRQGLSTRVLEGTRSGARTWAPPADDSEAVAARSANL